MKLCVGAASRRVVEEAAKLKVPQIVASRRQVRPDGGYTGLTPAALVDIVHTLSDGATQVVRDHGGPYQNGDPDDDWVSELDGDVEDGFDVLHLDVSKLPRTEQLAELTRLLERYADKVAVEIGGERDDEAWLHELASHTVIHVGVQPLYAVIDVGGHIWADRQQGYFRTPAKITDVTEYYHHTFNGVGTKAHNMDWAGNRIAYDNAVDAINIAPEYANVEIDAWLRVLPAAHVATLLDWGWKTKSWERWFSGIQGTMFERARAALRYHLNDEFVKEHLAAHLAPPHGDHASNEDHVRESIRDAILHT